MSFDSSGNSPNPGGPAPTPPAHLDAAIRAFLPDANGPAQATPHGGGHIHGTWKVYAPGRTLLLQRIHTGVFPDPGALMGNIERVTGHLHRALAGTPYRTLTLVLTSEGRSWAELDGSAWRAFEFLDGLRAHSLPTGPAMVAEAGRAFAAFAHALQTLPPASLAVPIPGFHSLSLRHRQLRDAARRTRLDLREPRLAPLLPLADRLIERLLPLERAATQGLLPTRIVHNDAKLDNLLFDASGRAVCVVDLDTVMPGIVHYDIGDSLRTLVPDRVEDDPDAESIVLRADHHRAYLDGYLEQARLSPEELRLLPLAAPYMACIMGIRFLADHLAGDRYYRIERPGHNLDRARNQLILARNFLETAPDLQ